MKEEKNKDIKLKDNTRSSNGYYLNVVTELEETSSEGYLVHVLIILYCFSHMLLLKPDPISGTFKIGKLLCHLSFIYLSKM